MKAVKPKLWPLLGLLTAGYLLHATALPAAERDWQKFVMERSGGNPPKPNAIICIGSSHMARWETVSKDLAPLKIYNYGIGGTTMSNAATKFAKNLVIPHRPRAVLLYEGSNDIARDATPEQILAHFKDFYTQIHKALPNTKIYVLGIVPSPGKRFERWPIIRRANDALKQECNANKKLLFIDTTSGLLTESGNPDIQRFLPGDIHMNAKGYAVWAEAVRPVVVPLEKRSEARRFQHSKTPESP